MKPLIQHLVRVFLLAIISHAMFRFTIIIMHFIVHIITITNWLMEPLTMKESDILMAMVMSSLIIMLVYIIISELIFKQKYKNKKE